MYSGYSGELKIGEKVLPITEWHMEYEYEPVEASAINLHEMIRQAQTEHIDIEGRLTEHGVNKISEMMYGHVNTSPIYRRVEFHTYWRCLYALQGKRYPSPHKRKSKMRMSKKWRDR